MPPSRKAIDQPWTPTSWTIGDSNVRFGVNSLKIGCWRRRVTILLQTNMQLASEAQYDFHFNIPRVVAGKAMYRKEHVCPHIIVFSLVETITRAPKY